MKNELYSYIEKNIEEHYEKSITLKSTKASEVIVYVHKGTAKKLILRRSKVRNDDVYRTLKGSHFEHIPTVYEVCSDGDDLVVLEEYIEGKTLSACLDNNLLKKRVACDYTKQICIALKQLHSRNIIHRDIKPSNIILKSDDTVVLADLSIARMISATQDSDTQALGTVGFAAPEQFGISQSGYATDIYALGVLLNIMLTGVHPTVKTAKGYVGKIIKKATATQISKRYQSAEQMYKALRFVI